MLSTCRLGAEAARVPCTEAGHAPSCHMPPFFSSHLSELPGPTNKSSRSLSELLPEFPPCAGEHLSPPRGESWWPHVSPLQSRQPGLGMLGGLDGWGLSGKSRDQLGKHTPFYTGRAPGKGR